MRISVTRSIEIPAPVLLARFERSPELGPKILFFSGGTALKKTSEELIRYTHNSIHIITPFDSGGSSAILRDAFAMPAIGDVRNRLLALADRSLFGNPEIFRLFAHRMPMDVDNRELVQDLEQMIRGEHELVSPIPDPMRKIIRHHLRLFREFMPDDFQLGKASIGNLILTAGYLENRRNIDSIIFIFSKLVQVRGIVRPVINQDLHLVAELESGGHIIGQHNLTGKEAPPITSRIERIFLSADPEQPKPCSVSIRNKMKDLIGQADMICYPMGSFFSSVMANLLPEGVSKAVRNNPCPKVFVPGTGKDPELFGHDTASQVRMLLRQLAVNGDDSATGAIDFIIVDTRRGDYPGGFDPAAVEQFGIRVIDVPLISEASAPLIDEALLLPVLLSLA